MKKRLTIGLIIKYLCVKKRKNTEGVVYSKTNLYEFN
jgi:hypothetical protein